MNEKRSFNPTPSLDSFIERYWIWSSDTPHRILLPAGTGIDFFIHIGTPFQVEYLDTGERLRCPAVHILCARNRCIRVITDSNTHFIATRFRLSSFRHFCPVPFPEHYDQITDANEWYGKTETARLLQLRTLTSQRKKPDLLNTFWQQHLNRYRKSDPWLDRLNNQLYYQHQTLHIEEVARHLGTSRRHMERTYKNRFGITPKQYHRMCRLHHTCRDVWLQRHSWLDSALTHGYYDQAHFVRECKRITGYTPGKLMQQHEMSHFYNPSRSASAI